MNNYNRSKEKKGKKREEIYQPDKIIFLEGKIQGHTTLHNG